MAESQPDHFVACNHWPAAVAGVDGGIDLDAQATSGVVERELDAGNDAFSDGQTASPSRETVSHHWVSDPGKHLGPWQRAMRLEERRILQLQHRQVNVGVGCFYRCGNPFTG